jgi:hypothetical protein
MLIADSCPTSPSKHVKSGLLPLLLLLLLLLLLPLLPPPPLAAAMRSANNTPGLLLVLRLTESLSMAGMPCTF